MHFADVHIDYTTRFKQDSLVLNNDVVAYDNIPFISEVFRSIIAVTPLSETLRVKNLRVLNLEAQEVRSYMRGYGREVCIGAFGNRLLFGSDKLEEINIRAEKIDSVDERNLREYYSKFGVRLSVTRVKEGKYLADLWKDGFIDGGFSTFIFVYPDGTVHKEKHSLDTLYDRFLSGQLSCCLTGRSVVAFHRFEYRKFIESKEYQLISGRNRITGADCGVKVVENNGIHAGAITLHDFFPNNGVCEAMDDIDFVDISEFSNEVRVLDLYACKHLRGVNVNLYKLDGFSLIYPNSENYRDENFRLDDCNQVSITGEVRATDVVVYASACESLKKVLVCCEGTVSLKNIFDVLSSKSLKEIRVVCGQLEVGNRDIIKFARGEVKIEEDVSVKIEADRVVWLAYSTESPRNRDVAAGLSALPESLRGIIVRRER